MTLRQLSILKIASVLWMVWGLVHAFFGAYIMSVGASEGFAAIAAAVDPGALRYHYHPAVEGVLSQHAWNLLWVGLFTATGGVMIWRANMTAIWVTSAVGILTDLGYLMFIDIRGYGTFFPGTVMTLVSGSAFILCAWVWLPSRRRS